MEAPRSPPLLTSLYALAKLGQTKDIQKANLISSQYGYIISKSDSQTINSKDLETIIKTIEAIPDFVKKGVGDRNFYENVREGIGKIQLGEVEKKEIDAIANEVFSKSRHEMIDASSVKKVIEETANIIQAKVDGKNEGSAEETNILQDDFIIEGEEEKIEQARAAKVRAAKTTPLQLEAIDMVAKLISPENRHYILNKMGNLPFIENREDLKIFKNYIDALIKNKDTVYKKLVKGSILIKEEMQFIYHAYAKVEELVMSKNHFSQAELSRYRKTVESFLEQVFPLNTQICQDIFSNNPASYRYQRRQGNIGELRQKLDDQNARQREGKSGVPGDFTPEETNLIQNGFIQRDSGFNIWEKSEWIPEEIVVGENEQIFVKAKLTCSMTIPGQKPADFGVDFDFSKCGELSPTQAKKMMGYLEDFIFKTKQPAFPSELEFLSTRVVKDQEMDEFEIIPPFKTSKEEDFEVITPIDLELTAKNALIAMAQDKKNEVFLMITKANFQANHPELHF